MVLITTFIILINIIVILIMLLIPIVNIHKDLNREKNSPFECGFDPFSNSRLSFSIHFFCISLMFLIFDIEITLILPIPLIKSFLNMNSWLMFSLFMMTLLLSGLFLEWKEGSMEWK
uniref:NADH-ubiquinone oxidoreductase chain 3 n=1 Tax=Trioza anthrisci TaxID=2023874 RepID=A0A344A2S9_9HEMI|nr:NADH dehydrogenase subunit 3 [Trioza anthrisci]AWU49070.1 NADH dehydrogenase subunit 3 [Trioza anthrisci]